MTITESATRLTERGSGGTGDAIRVESAVNHYLASRIDFSAKTRRESRYVLMGFVRFLGPDTDVRALRRRTLERWLVDRAKTVVPSTLRNQFSVIRGFCAWLAANSYTAKNHADGIRAPRQPPSIPRELETQMVSSTVAHAPDLRAELILLLMVHEGLRRAEVAGIGIGDLDRKDHMLLVHGKGNKDRWVPVSGETWIALVAYLSAHPAAAGPLIRSYNTNRGLSPNWIGTLVSRWLYEAGVKHHACDGVSPHALRHTMAGVMLDEGADIRDVQEALGHASLAATYRYLQRRRAAGQLRKVMGRRSYRQSDT